MPNAKIDSLGYIIGGSCDKNGHLRAARTRAAWNIWEYMLKNGYVKTSETGCHYKIIKPFKKDWRWIQKRFSCDAHSEIGALRFKLDLLPCLPEGYFSKMELGNWIDCFCQGPCNIGAPFNASPLPPYKLSFVPFPDTNNDIYQARRKRGDFGDVPAYQGTITRDDVK